MEKETYEDLPERIGTLLSKVDRNAYLPNFDGDLYALARCKLLELVEVYEGAKLIVPYAPLPEAPYIGGLTLKGKNALQALRRLRELEVLAFED